MEVTRDPTGRLVTSKRKGSASKNAPPPRREWCTPATAWRPPRRNTAPTTGMPRQSTPMEQQKMPSPLMKLVVPSSGSMAQTKSAPGAP